MSKRKWEGENKGGYVRRTKSDDENGREVTEEVTEVMQLDIEVNTPRS